VILIWKLQKCSISSETHQTAGQVNRPRCSFFGFFHLWGSDYGPQFLPTLTLTIDQSKGSLIGAFKLCGRNGNKPNYPQKIFYNKVHQKENLSVYLSKLYQ
jgi:hypothetical protein